MLDASTRVGPNLRAALVAESPPEAAAGPHARVWQEYALSANERGRELLDKVRRFVPRLRGRRHLDVGCGYGGACVALAAAGARSVGIERDEGLLRLAEANRADHPGLAIELMRRDALAWAELEPLGRFDVITCDNVIEHVRSPERLILHLRRLLAPRGLLLLTAPNAFAVEQVRRDCHWALLGLSLLDPADGDAYVRATRGATSMDVSRCHRLETYLDLFTRHGLAARLLYQPAASAEHVAAIRGSAAALEREVAADLPQPVAERLRLRVAEFLEALRVDLEAYDGARGRGRHRLARWLIAQRELELWNFAVSPDPHVIAPTFRERSRAASAEAFHRYVPQALRARVRGVFH